MQPTIFLHIPKTAGTTLRNLAYRNYDKDRIHESYDEALWYEGIDQQGGEQWELIFGHVRYGYHKYLSKPFAYATMMRNPLERVYSHYRHFLRSHEEHHKQQAIEYPSFLAFCSSPSAYNIQTRMLSGVYDYDEFLKNEEDILELAKANLDNMLAVGIAGRFEDSLLLFREKLGWRILRYTRQNEDTLNRHELSEEERLTAESVNRYDLELFSYAKQLFEKELNNINSLGTKKRLLRLELKLAAVKNKYMG